MAERYSKVLVALDGSPRSERALMPAAELAHKTGLALAAVHVTSGSSSAARIYLTDAVVDYCVEPDDLIVVVDRPPVKAVLDTAAAEKAVVFCATHGRGGLGNALLGSTARGLLETGGEPLWMIGAGFDSDRWRRFGRLVVAMDEGLGSMSQLGPVALWAQALDMPVTLATGTTGAVGEASTAHLDELVAELRTIGIQAETLIRHDPTGPAAAVATLVQSSSNSAVAVATRQRDDLDRIRHRSVAASILRRSAVPVLVTPVAA